MNDPSEGFGILLWTMDSNEYSPSDLEDQRTIGPYRLVDLLGQGGMGQVFRAWDTKLDRWVAVKSLKHDKRLNPSQRKRLTREARLIADLSHPSIVDIFDLLEVDEELFIVMEYLEGYPLSRIIDDRLPLDLTLDYGHQIAVGLAVIHEKGIIHRDLKPQNVFLVGEETSDPDSESGTDEESGRFRRSVKLIDFGISKTLWGVGQSTLTRPGAVVGSVGSMAPEQITGQKLDTRADLFALGVLLYQMATGKHPFKGETSLVTLKNMLHSPQIPAKAIEPTLPAPLSELIDSMLAKMPYDRPENAGAVAKALNEFQSEL